MKSPSIRPILLLVCACLAASACQPLPDAGKAAAPQILDVHASEVTETEATLSATVHGAERMEGYGFVYGKSDTEDATASDGLRAPSRVAARLNGDVFTARIQGLEENTTYLFAAFADNGAGLSRQTPLLSFHTLSHPAPPEPDLPDQQEVRIPDEHFRAWLLWHFDTDRDGRLSRQEASQVGTIEINTDDIASLEGMEAFSGLIKLHAAGSLKEGVPLGLLESVDLSGNPKLGMVYLPHNQIKEIDLRPVPLTDYLDMTHNRLETIDLRPLVQATLISLGENRLTEVDVRGLAMLDELHCEGNPMSVIRLDNPRLRYLNCAQTRLKELDLRRCPALNTLDCTACPDLATIRLVKGQTLGQVRKDEHTTLVYE